MVLVALKSRSQNDMTAGASRKLAHVCIGDCIGGCMALFYA